MSRIASATGRVDAMASLAHALGESALLKNRPAEAAEQFLKAAEQCQKLNAPMDLARAEYRAGVALARCDRKEDAIRQLTNAYRRAKKLGARPLSARIAEALEGLGEHADERGDPGKAERSIREGLTRRQVVVLRQIAEGRSNKEIAASLYLSPRTVEMHAARILDRLNCRSRVEAVRRAGEMGILV